MTNQIKTFVLLALLSGLFIVLGSAMGGRTGLIIAFAFSLIMTFGSYWFSDSIVLRMNNARELSPTESPALYRMVEQLAIEANIPRPKLYLIEDPVPNAFATGRNPEHGVVAVTAGLIKLLNPDEIKGVIAHEIAHIKNRDILVQSVAVVIGSSIVAIANMMQWAAIFGVGSSNGENRNGSFLGSLLMIILAPIAASIIQMAISRSREYMADATGASLTHNPLALASALHKIDAYSRNAHSTALNPATESLYIINPFSGRSIASLFSTHPATEDRIRKLEELNRRP
ncbi:zinc metalloprotease HtpX [Desulfovibrio litoralis]|uniref:Protease HtpX homolog n=1 Tax=Desulfovibrio litoralis DSM 11393 TaxID=1121455 RepID=A0A1M7SL50_9BACT|nr:zinc metalloprotease HtpX [Desulfovibrio litoralis]SHN59197.1 heat shock protein HtpX [Desulfovibrio litoralis DSM 11393]